MDALKIALVSSEVTPFAKTGGLADVTAALGRALGNAGHDARIFLPMYRRIREGAWSFTPVPALQDLALDLGGRRITVSVSTTPLPGSEVEVYLVRCPELYDRPDIYGGGDDEFLRFAVLCRAAIESCQHLGWGPDVFHCNDWHTGLLPLWLKAGYAWDRLFAGTKTVLTIHNIAYQGVFGSEVLAQLGWEESRDLLYQEDLSEGTVNYLKTGLLYADAITTVSETYAREIRTAEYGMGLDELLEARSADLVGIVNGVDYGEWNPETDANLEVPYGPGDLAGKKANTDALLAELGLAPDPAAPVLGIVSRLTFQKGFELLPDVLPVVLQREDVRLCVLGSGEQKHEDYFRWLAESFRGRVSFTNGYDDRLAHRIEAGAELFLMPSRYEPCGLNQMYSLKYGTAPLVRRTGGLADTVERFDPETGEGDGFVFDEFSSEALFSELARAVGVFRDRAAWETLVRNAMAADWSWDRQVQQYVELYRRLVRPATPA